MNIFHLIYFMIFLFFVHPWEVSFFVHKNPVTINVTIVTINVIICAHALVPTPLETFKYVINSKTFFFVYQWLRVELRWKKSKSRNMRLLQ